MVIVSNIHQQSDWNELLLFWSVLPGPCYKYKRRIIDHHAPPSKFSPFACYKFCHFAFQVFSLRLLSFVTSPSKFYPSLPSFLTSPFKFPPSVFKFSFSAFQVFSLRHSSSLILRLSSFLLPPFKFSYFAIQVFFFRLQVSYRLQNFVPLPSKFSSSAFQVFFLRLQVLLYTSPFKFSSSAFQISFLRLSSFLTSPFRFSTSALQVCHLASQVLSLRLPRILPPSSCFLPLPLKFSTSTL